MRLRGSVTTAIHNSTVTGYDVTCARIDDSDTDGDSSTPKLDTPIMMKNFLCDTAGVAFNKEMPLEGSTVIEEGISFDETMAIVNTSLCLILRVELPHKITVRLLCLMKHDTLVQWIRLHQLHVVG